MHPTLLGLHHVTATVDEAQADLTFAAGLLGLRLVKKTVNFDNAHVYHFYYGDERGTPGTIWTTFPYRGHGVRPGRIGAAQITATSFSVPAGSEPFWLARLEAGGVVPVEHSTRFGETVLAFRDPSGLNIELVAGHRDTRTPWIRHDVPGGSAIRGVHSVTITSQAPGPTLEFMSSALGFAVSGTDGARTRLTVNGDLPGHTIDVVEAPGTPRGSNGLGTVHHVAMAVASDDDQLRFRELLLNRGIVVTPVVDRQYFHSIYFREPGGVLFEIATMEPGFLIDEPIDALGQALKLPSWEESHRPDIEAGLAAAVAPQ